MIIRKPRFWQMFMAKVFDNPDLDSSLLDLAQVWKKMINRPFPFIDNSMMTCTYIQDYKYIDVDPRNLKDYFSKAKHCELFGYHYADALHIQIKPGSKYRMCTDNIYLGMIPVIFKNIKENGSVPAGGPSSSDKYSLNNMLIPRCPKTEDFFQKIIEMEDNLTSNVAGTDINFVRRVKDTHQKWFSIDVGIKKFHSFGSIEHDCAHLSEHLNTQRVTCLTSPNLQIVTEAIVILSIKNLWTIPKKKQMGLQVSNLRVLFFPMNIPQEWKLFRKQPFQYKVCRCQKCINNREWQVYLDQYGNQEFYNKTEQNTILGLDDDVEPDIDSLYKKFINYQARPMQLLLESDEED